MPDPSTPPYSEATVELVTAATEQHYLSDGRTDAMGNSACSCGQWWDAAGDNPGWDQHMAEVALKALAEAGLLPPEGAERVEEWRVTGDPGGGFPPYEFVWSPQRNPQLGDSEREARCFAALIEESGGWPDGPHLSKRTVITTPWSAVPPEPKEGDA